MTIKDLKKICEKQIAIGNGDKTIYISADDEGNSFHELFYAFTTLDPEKEAKEWEKLTGEKVNDIKSYMESLYLGIDYKDMKNTIILG